MKYAGHRLLFAVVILLGGCVTAGARSRPAPQWRTQVNAQRADRQVLLRRVVFRVDTAGRVVQEHWQRQRVLTDRGADVFCDPRVTWDSARQRFGVLRAHTRMRSGRVVKTPASGVNRVTPRALALAPAYAHFTDTVVSLLGIEPGAVTDLGYRLTDRKASPLPFGGRVAVGDVGPMKKLVVVVELPTGKTLRHACLGCPPARPVIQRVGAHTRYTWTFTNLRAVNLYERRTARRQPPSTDPLPQLVFTTATSWAAALAPLRKGLVSARVSPAVAALAKRLTQSAKTTEDKLIAAVRFVTRSLRLVRFDGLRRGAMPASAAKVLRRGYGHRLDRGVLLLALLRGLGISARPVLLQRGPRLATSVPTVAQLGPLWIEVQLGKAALWVSPRTGKFVARGTVGHGRYHVDLAGALKPVKITRSPATSGKLAVAGTVDPRGRVRWQAAVSLTGLANPFAGTGAWMPKRLKRIRKGLHGRLWSGADKDSKTTTSRPGLLRTRFTARLVGKLAKAEAKLQSLRLPDACGFLKRVGVLRDKAQLPLRLPAPKLSCKLALSVAYAADTFEPVIRPRSLTVKNAVGAYKRLVKVGKGRLNVVVKLTLKGPWVAPARVADLRSLLAAARSEEAHLVVFRRLKKAPALGPVPRPAKKPPQPRPHPGSR